MRSPSSHCEGAITPSARGPAASAKLPSPPATAASYGRRVADPAYQGHVVGKRPGDQQNIRVGLVGHLAGGDDTDHRHAQPSRRVQHPGRDRPAEGAAARGQQHAGAAIEPPRHGVEGRGQVAARGRRDRDDAGEALYVVGARPVVPQHPAALAGPTGGFADEVAPVRAYDQIGAGHRVQRPPDTFAGAPIVNQHELGRVSRPPCVLHRLLEPRGRPSALHARNDR